MAVITLAGGGALGRASGGLPLELYADGRTVTNIKSAPYSAVGNGVADDFDNFYAFALWAGEQAGSLVLYVPVGTYNVGTTLGGLFSVYGPDLLVATGPYKSPSDIKIFAPGATFNSPIQIGSPSGLRQVGYFTDTATAGDRTIHFVTPGDATNFVTDINGDPLTWVCMTALDLQAPSLPTNTHYFEFCEIESVNTTANTVTFKRPLARSYKSTYPTINWYQSYSDGPAMAYPMDPRWDMELSIDGEKSALASFTNVTQCYINARKVTLRYINITGDGIASGQCKDFLVEDSVLCTGQSEWDKLITNLTIRRCTGFFVTFQSSSIYNVDIDGLTLSSAFSGTPYNLTMANASIAGALNIGSGYGWCNSVVVEDSSFTDLAYLRNTLLISSFSSSAGGVLVRPLHIDGVDRPIPWAVEGARLYIHASNTICLGYYGTVTDVRQNGSNIEVVTDAVGAFPVITGTYPSVRVGTIGCKTIEMTNCTGCVQALEKSLAPTYPANGSLPGEFYNRTHDGSVRQPPGGDVFGHLVSIRVNVTQAYAGPQGSCLLHVAAASGVGYINTSLSDGQWDPVLNLKIAGERTFTPGGGLVGGQSGDSFPAFSADNWLLQFGPYFATDISAEGAGARPVVTVEAIFDHGAA